MNCIFFPIVVLAYHLAISPLEKMEIVPIFVFFTIFVTIGILRIINKTRIDNYQNWTTNITIVLALVAAITTIYFRISILLPILLLIYHIYSLCFIEVET